MDPFLHRFSPFFVGCYFYAHLVVICKLSQAHCPPLANVHMIIFWDNFFLSSPPSCHLVNCRLSVHYLEYCLVDVLGGKKKSPKNKKTKNTFLHSHHPLVVICEKPPFFCRCPRQFSF